MPEAKIVRVQELEAPTGARIPVAWLDLGGRSEVAVPLARLAEAVEYNRGAIYRLVDNDPVLSQYRVVVVTATPKGVPHRTAFLQRPGVLGVLVKISTARIQDPLKRERIQAFQRWAFESLDRLLFEGQVPRQPSLFEDRTSLPGPSAPASKPSKPTVEDREWAARMLVGEIRDQDGRLLSYGRIEAITGVPKTTLIRMAQRLGVRKWRGHRGVYPIHDVSLLQESGAPTPSSDPLLREVARLLAQQAEALAALLRKLRA